MSFTEKVSLISDSALITPPPPLTAIKYKKASNFDEQRAAAGWRLTNWWVNRGWRQGQIHQRCTERLLPHSEPLDLQHTHTFKVMELLWRPEQLLPPVIIWEDKRQIIRLLLKGDLFVQPGVFKHRFWRDSLLLPTGDQLIIYKHLSIIITEAIKHWTEPVIAEHLTDRLITPAGPLGGPEGGPLSSNCWHLRFKRMAIQSRLRCVHTNVLLIHPYLWDFLNQAVINTEPLPGQMTHSHTNSQPANSPKLPIMEAVN